MKIAETQNEWMKRKHKVSRVKTKNNKNEST